MRSRCRRVPPRAPLSHTAGSSRRSRLAFFFVVGCAAVVVISGVGCLFAPDIASYGYTECASDDDCPPSRYCEAQLCAPPPWRDECYRGRQAIVVENPGPTPLLAGAAVPVVIGEGGLLTIEELGAEGRFSVFDRGSFSWSESPVFKDIDNRANRLIAHLPVAEDVPAGQSATLAWVETDFRPEDPDEVFEPQADAPSQVFSHYERFRDELNAPLSTLDETRWETVSGDDVLVSDGAVTIADNQKLAYLVPLAPPFSLTFLGAFDGIGCDRVYLGVQGDDGASFEPPAAGFFGEEDLALVTEVFPREDAALPIRAATPRALEQPTVVHRYTLQVGEGRVRTWVDGVVFDDLSDLDPAFEGDELYAVIDIDGACSFRLLELWASPLPFSPPALSATGLVERLEQ